MPAKRATATTAPRYPGVWEGKQPCWVVVACSPYVRDKCAAYLHPEKPCWEHENTHCEKVLGLSRTCTQCAVFARYHAA